MNTELLYQLSLCQVPHIGHVHTKTLCDIFGSASQIFKAPQSALENIDGVGEVRARSIKTFRDFSKAEKEIGFIEKYGIQPLFLTDKDYPQRLLNCYDPPALLFYKGKANLNGSKMVAIVGTRNHSEYGRQATEKLVKELSAMDIITVSGLAFGIDAIAHSASIKSGLPTIGVVGHGLDIIYPQQNTRLAREMTENGGLLTEFRSKTKPDKHHFPSRNRIVAGICDACIIVESGIKGGSMITADIAGSYNRDVFAIPGRLTDLKSAGCNELVRNNKAILFNGTEKFIETMGWADPAPRKTIVQKQLFAELADHEKKVMEVLTSGESLHIDEINLCCGLSMSTAAEALLNLEIHGIVRSFPGKRYGLTH